MLKYLNSLVERGFVENFTVEACRDVETGSDVEVIRLFLHCDPRSIRTATRIFDTLSRKAAALPTRPVINVTVGFSPPSRAERAARRPAKDCKAAEGFACNP